MISVTLHLDRWGINMTLENIQRMQMVQEAVQSPNTRRDDLQVMRRGSQGFQVPPSAPQRLQAAPQDARRSGIFPGIMEEHKSLHDLLKEDLPIHIADLKERGTSPEALEKMDEFEEQVSLQDIGTQAIGFNPVTATAKDGGLIGMAAGGMFEGRVPGDGHGMQDNVFMPIQERGEQVATLAVSPKEYVVDAHTMSAIGNGNADKGADVMDNVVENIREKAYGTDQQPNQIDGLAALRPMIERV